MNALRYGGSQTYAFTLCDILRESGLHPIIIAKSGSLSDTARRHAQIIHVRWVEGTARTDGSYAKKAILHAKKAILHTLAILSLLRVALLTIRKPPCAIIASQPWPIYYMGMSKHLLWRSATRIALIHGFTSVEMPPPVAKRTFSLYEGVFATTHEAKSHLASEHAIQAHFIGNLFDADAYWQGIPPRETTYQSTPIIFLGTLTPNKVAPLHALFPLLQSFRHLMLTVVGDGVARRDLEEHTVRLGVTRQVNFEGAVDDPRTIIHRARLVVTAGRGVIESASHGCPVVVASSDGIFGPLRLRNLELCSSYNFTGRAPGSLSPSSTHIADAITEASALSRSELAAIAQKLRRVGDVTKLLTMIVPHDQHHE